MKAITIQLKYLFLGSFTFLLMSSLLLMHSSTSDFVNKIGHVQLEKFYLLTVIMGLITLFILCWNIHLYKRYAHYKNQHEKLKFADMSFTHSCQGIMITDSEAKILKVNKSFTQITGYAPDEVVGRDVRILQSKNQAAEFYEEMWQTLNKTDFWQGEIVNRRKSGEKYTEALSITRISDIKGCTQYYLAIFDDITKKKTTQQQLERNAHYDFLTNLPNRILMADRLEKAMIQSLRRNSTLAVLFLDLDGFKEINDTHGHDVGDQVLITTSQRVIEALREGDTLARIGGDEFVAILEDIGCAANCELILNRVLKAVSKPILVKDESLNITISIGFTCFPNDCSSIDELILQADHAMYVAKRSGKNRYHCFNNAT